MRLGGVTLVGWLNSELLHELAEVGPGEFPFEGGGDGLIVALEAQESGFKILERGEVVGDQGFTLNDRKIDLDLVEPAGVDWGVDQHQVGKGGPQPVQAGRSAMRGAIVHDPEDPPGAPVRSLGHYLAHQTIERCDPGLGLAAAEESGVVNIEGREVGPRTDAAVFMLDPSGPCGLWRQGWMFADARLDTGLLVGADHELISFQALTLPVPGVEIQHAAGLAHELGIAGKDPTAVLPRTDRVVVEPAPHRLVADGGDDARALGFAHDIGGAQARQRSAKSGGQLTRDGLYLHDQFRGGENRGPTRTWSLLEPGQALFKEAFAPETNH